MKKVIVGGIILLGVIVYSCNKEQIVESSLNKNEVVENDKDLKSVETPASLKDLDVLGMAEESYIKAFNKKPENLRIIDFEEHIKENEYKVYIIKYSDGINTDAYAISVD